MSLRRLVESKLRRAALGVLEEHVPGAAEVVAAVEQWATERAPIEAPAAPVGPRSKGGEAATIDVEILDERGRVVGWTTATKE